MKLEESPKKNMAHDKEAHFHSEVEYKKLKNYLMKDEEIDLKKNEVENNCGFRLGISSTKDFYDDATMSVSSYSTSKQRIDAMFDDSRSILSDLSKRSFCKNHKNNNLTLCQNSQVTNNIEERIKKMFEEISISDWRDNENSKTIQLCSEEFTTTFNSAEKQMFVVTYLGSKPIHEKSVNLRSIQDPLKDLYFNYKKNTSKDEVNFLTIAKEGLKIKFQDKEELHTFNTIAVWASVKLSFRRTFNTMEFAFIPIVIDPEGIDKNTLFRELKNEDKYEKLRNFQMQSEGTHYPIFAVVMKNLNKNKQLECHGFICKSSEEAIIIAANLYRALVKKMKRKKEQKTENEEENNEKVHQKNDLIKMSDTKLNENLKNKKETLEKSKTVSPKSADVFPDAKESTKFNSLKTTTICKNEFSTSLKEDQESNKEKLNRSEKENMSKERRNSAPEKIFGLEFKNLGKTLRRTESDKGGGVVVNEQFCDGDVLTKVTIPRSSSFLNANGPLSRFPRCQTSNTKNHSPLGFKELFNEFHLHEGLENMDDILNVIIDAEGMSFNDLKPIYKEFLLKLAVTLTKDELYQRSKVIMRRQKKRNQNSTFKKKKFIANMGLEKIFKKSKVEKSRNQRKTKSSDLEFTSVVFHPSNKHILPNLSNVKLLPYRNKKSQKLRRKLTKRLTKQGKKQKITSSRANNFLQLKSRFCQKEKKSSNCFSCNGSTYNSENCTCSSLGTCSCMIDVKNTEQPHQQYLTRALRRTEFVENYQVEDSVNTCSCDTESCTDSGKCYCAKKDNRNSSNFNCLPKNIVNTPSFRKTDNEGNGSFPVLHENSSTMQKNHSSKKTKDKAFSWSKSNLLYLSNSSCSSKSHKTWSDLIHSQNESPHKASEKMYVRSAPFSVADDQHLKEIQNIIFPEDIQDSNLKTQNIWLSNDKKIQSTDYHCPSSLRRSGSLVHLTNTHRNASCKSKSFLGSQRHRNDCEHRLQSHNRPIFEQSNLTNSSLRFTKRMDVYNSCNSEKNIRYNRSFRNYPSTDFTRPKCQVHHDYNLSVENLRGDKTEYSTRKDKNNCTTKFENTDSLLKINKKKVLVVSARDSKGKVVYMGTSNKYETPVKNSNNRLESNVKAENEALAIKKSAEIAALFCEISTKSKLSYFNSLKEHNKNIHWSLSNSFKDSNLENTLGYFP